LSYVFCTTPLRIAVRCRSGKTPAKLRHCCEAEILSLVTIPAHRGQRLKVCGVFISSIHHSLVRIERSQAEILRGIHVHASRELTLHHYLTPLTLTQICHGLMTPMISRVVQNPVIEKTRQCSGKARNYILHKPWKANMVHPARDAVKN
jgi:hypothetical protein